MVDSRHDPLLEGLRTAGLNRYEASVYLGLLTDQTARVAEISRRTGVPQPKVYQALDSLSEKGFCTLGADAVNRYRPVPPGDVLAERVKALETEKVGLHRLGEELEELRVQGQGQEAWAPPVEVVKGLNSIRRFLVESIEEARQEVLFFGKAPQVPAQDVAQALWDAATRGVRLRMVFEPDYFEAAEERAEEDDLYRRLPGERRLLADLPSKLLILDQKVSLASVDRPGSDGFLVLVLRDPGLLGHVQSSFEEAWAKARPFD